MLETLMIEPDVGEQSQRDVVFTPLMLRVREAVRGAATTGSAAVQVSSLHGIAQANDEWVALRCRAEQVVAEANAMLTASTGPRFELVDEFGMGPDGQAVLAFVVGYGDRTFRLWLTQSGRQAWIELLRSWVDTAEPLEPVDQAALEDLLVEILVGERSVP
jgi:hypothetical protein